MAKDTLTLALNGEVALSEFAEAISHFRGLVDALGKDLGLHQDIQWFVDDLQSGSTITTIRGEADPISKVERLVSAYGEVGMALQAGSRPNFSDLVIKEAESIIRVLNSHVTSVRFETADNDAVVSSQPISSEFAGTAGTVVTQGAIEGRIQTVTERKGLRFTLYDTLHDRAVSCYLKEGQEDLMRQLWGKRAIVEGEVSRERDTGRPVAIRQILDVHVLPETRLGSYQSARGIAPRRPDAPLAEEVIRQLRDV